MGRERPARVVRSPRGGDGRLRRGLPRRPVGSVAPTLRSPAKARHLAADICAVVCGLRPACMIDYAPKIDAGVARAVLETLRADPRSGRHREVRALGVLLVEDVVLIADLDRVMRVFDDIGATGGADRFVAFDPTSKRRMRGTPTNRRARDVDGCEDVVALRRPRPRRAVGRPTGPRRG